MERRVDSSSLDLTSLPSESLRKLGEEEEDEGRGMSSPLGVPTPME